MVKLDKIYTRGGDKGKTSLTGGERVAKDHVRVEAMGAVDEANAAIGLAALHASGKALLMLKAIQHDLFDLGADLSTPMDKGGGGALRVTAPQVERLEHEIDHMNIELQPLSSFVLHGGTVAASYLRLARTMLRRAERMAVKANNDHQINDAALRYLNRLSDHLFVLGRHLNDKGEKDILWVPGKNRES